MTKPFSSIGKKLPANWNSIWRGGDRARPGLTKLFWAILWLLLAVLSWTLAIQLARSQPPFKIGSVVAAIVTLALIIWPFRELWQSIIFLGVKRIVFIFISVYGIILVVNVLTVPSTDPVSTRVMKQLGATGHQMWNSLTSLLHSGIHAPDDFLFAYTGQQAPPPPVPWFPTPHPDATPIQGFAVSAGKPSPSIPVQTRQPEPSTSSESTVSPVQTEQITPIETNSLQITLVYPEIEAFIRRGEAEQYFSWNIEGNLSDNQSFEIRFYKIGESEFDAPFGWVKENGQNINLNALGGSGEYEWSVVIVQGIDGNWERDVYESPRRPINWEG